MCLLERKGDAGVREIYYLLSCRIGAFMEFSTLTNKNHGRGLSPTCCCSARPRFGKIWTCCCSSGFRDDAKRAWIETLLVALHTQSKVVYRMAGRRGLGLHCWTRKSKPTGLSISSEQGLSKDLRAPGYQALHIRFLTRPFLLYCYSLVIHDGQNVAGGVQAAAIRNLARTTKSRTYLWDRIPC
jgi:hypothetical protein